MSTPNTSHVTGTLPHEPEKATLEGRNKILGFWLFLGGEAVLFGTLFATFLTLRNQIADGPSASELFNLPMTAAATFILLVSSLTSVFAIQAMHRGDKGKLAGWLGVTVLLGLAFLVLEIYEFAEYVLHEEYGMTTSAFSSAFYTLVGFHGAHVLFGILWISLLIGQLFKKGLNVVTAPKVYVSAIYWHFIDVVWVFIFTVVYLLGKVV
ncbi:Cytochrome c oxidase subunit 3 [compost metagenome]|jgi:cytochrome c oxidase subunit III|uniref:Cytochrome (Ubi)quinol oxidase subunit III n=2 Tax=Paenibacillus TaxID=44249 RepID=A0A9X1Y1U4_9BACL|nr:MULTISPECIES: cytochrome (ubi)quinol oxidase subunit III [Paenibacillus]MBW4840471.1 cytochrome (ubi)quinol oxidase subunit III [Paenibacillaceae bacterium]MBM6997626.1 cytochrome (ubi)quinol oxidase subunit III [Paenibacillus rhizolycopersici]MCK8490045.1 cytochrome (ubi)quinol oxidase subunit III [Paenibacillus mellifer]MUG87594.1 cytochrome (ubi)quinol oxidase subunit III [Paenibacillus timonensis]GIP49913.1 cytochrome c oxidase subunit 3 [Paenibacillus sp. J53TS2]